MPKINELPYLDSTALYYHEEGFVLVANGKDSDSGDYVTGQISGNAALGAYVGEKVGYPDGYFSEESKILYKESSEDSEIWGTSVGSLTSTVVSCMLSENYLSEYLSTYIYDYITSGYVNSYISEYLSSYIGEIAVTDTSDLSGIVTRSIDGNSFEYIPTSSLADLICSCIYYDGPYPDTLADDTYLAGISDYDDDRKLAYITLGDIVSYIREHL